jgi:hypothetical protein
MKFLAKLFLLTAMGTFFYAGMFPAAALHAAPFTIVYSNDVLGELELCGCDDEQLGGLSRKASVITALKKEGRPVLVSDAALLVEAGAHLRFDRLVVVHCPPDEQLRRLTSRDGLPEAAARDRLATQWPIAEKARRATDLIDTSGSFADTDRQVDAVCAALDALGRASARGLERPAD